MRTLIVEPFDLTEKSFDFFLAALHEVSTGAASAAQFTNVLGFSLPVP